jgi:phenylpropionate dioxygenase-like ring-hydroxylating dioxygenase large terminal subunit
MAATEDARSASKEFAEIYPRYNAAVTGFRNYWYPVLFSHQLGKQPVSLTVCGEKIGFFRDRGQPRALHNRCPHRGVPLTLGRKEFPGTITCAYHGWTYDLTNGQLVGVLTDGPDSPICGKATVAVKAYPVEERAGLIWVCIGDGEPVVPVERDIPDELLRPNTALQGTWQYRKGNWRFAMENGADEGHGKYLHRTNKWVTFRELPAWSRTIEMYPSDDGIWLERRRTGLIWRDQFPGLGPWPKKPAPFWKRRNTGGTDMALRLPCMLRLKQKTFMDYELYVPSDEDHYISLLLGARWTNALGALWWALEYRYYTRPFFHREFNYEDQVMVENMTVPPEQLYRPDVSITALRRFLNETARRTKDEPPTNGESTGETRTFQRIVSTVEGSRR